MEGILRVNHRNFTTLGNVSANERSSLLLCLLLAKSNAAR